MIRNFTIKNFKSFREATLPLAPLTVLIGANASGKSNAVEAIQLLSWVASGRPLSDLFYAVREQELFLRGGFADLSGDGGDITLGCEVAADPESPPVELSFRVSEKDLQIKAGRLLLHPLATHLSSIFFLDPDPRRMREYSFLQEKQLKRDGSALSSVLRHLTEEEGKKARILEVIRSVPEQDISDITYLETPREEVMVQLHETFGGKVVPREAALLSDGTLRVLAVAAALFSVPEGSVIVIEEIDNGVHPSRAEKLLQDLQRIARERNLRLLLTTHNPALLDAVPPEAVPDIVACYRDPEQGDSRLIRLEDLESYPELVAQGPVGRLVTKGILDRYLKAPDKRDEAAKVDQGLAWMSEFRRARSS